MNSSNSPDSSSAQHHHAHAHSRSSLDSDLSPLSLEMIASACIRREAEALSESSGFVVPPTYVHASAKAQNYSSSSSVSTDTGNSRHSPPHLHQLSLPDDDIARAERQKAVSRLKSKRANASRTPQKKIRYECRKQLADSRPRVKGRFVAKTQEKQQETIYGRLAEWPFPERDNGVVLEAGAQHFSMTFCDKYLW